MEAYRDQYATLFNGGNNVKVIGISVDADTTLASWAQEKSFPMLFASDTNGTVGRKYFSYDEKRKMDTRTLFVVAPDGRITYIARPFNVMSQNAYTELEAAVDSAARHGS
jgi:peroxiredoxin Q/BCP